MSTDTQAAGTVIFGHLAEKVEGLRIAWERARLESVKADIKVGITACQSEAFDMFCDGLINEQQLKTVCSVFKKEG